MAVSCENRNEALGSTKDEEFLEKLSDYRRLKKDSNFYQDLKVTSFLTT
jgi:hypothetical protein